VTADGTTPLARCGIDTVDIARVERLLLTTPKEDLLRIFSKEELSDVGEGAGRTASLAARFAAKEACMKLFPRETALGLIGPEDFALARDGYGASRIVCSPRALELIARHGLRAIAVSLAHDKTRASAVVVAEPASPRTKAPRRSELPQRGTDAQPGWALLTRSARSRAQSLDPIDFSVWHPGCTFLAMD
jgi:holo-[acyl-carrier-protein] synthase